MLGSTWNSLVMPLMHTFFTHILVFEVLDAIETVAVPVTIIYTTPLSAEKLKPIASKRTLNQFQKFEQLIYQLPFPFHYFKAGFFYILTKIKRLKKERGNAIWQQKLTELYCLGVQGGVVVLVYSVDFFTFTFFKNIFFKKIN
ncbi:hypothetical protein ACJX0J_024725, partial [Zea mays]